MSRLVKTIQLLLLAVTVPTGARAQAPSKTDAMAIDAAVAAYLQPSLPAAGLVFDPRVQRSGGWVDVRSAARTRAFAAALHATAVTHESVYQCRSHHAADCSLLAPALLAFSEPSISGDKAVVRMQRLDRGSYARIPVYSQTMQLNLVRDAGGWRVVSRDILSES